MDIVYVLGTILFFGLSWWFVRACESLEESK